MVLAAIIVQAEPANLVRLPFSFFIYFLLGVDPSHIIVDAEAGGHMSAISRRRGE